MYEEIAEGNYKIALHTAAALRDADMAYDVLAKEGKYQQQLSQMRQELLEQERKDHAQDLWFYRGIIALGLVVVVAL